MMLLRHLTDDFAFDIELRLSQHYFDYRDLPFQSCVFKVYHDILIVPRHCLISFVSRALS